MSSITAHLPPATKPAAKPVKVEPKPFTMRDAQMRMIPLSAVVVFAIFALFSYVMNGNVGEALGVGAFMAFWIGGGFGAIMGGALWNHHNEASLYKD